MPAGARHSSNTTKCGWSGLRVCGFVLIQPAGNRRGSVQ
jgi:hypothetical protein